LESPAKLKKIKVGDYGSLSGKMACKSNGENQLGEANPANLNIDRFVG